MNLYEIKEYLDKYEPKLILHEKVEHLISAEFDVPKTNVKSDILYILDACVFKKFSKILLTKPISLLIIGADTQNQYEGHANLLLLPANSDPEQIFRQVSELFHQNQKLASFSQILLEILADNGSLQNIIDEAFSILNNPIVVLDAGFKLLATNLDVKHYNTSFAMLNQIRYLESSEIEILNKHHIHAKVIESNVPLCIHAPEFEDERISARINIGSKNIGFLTVRSLNLPFCKFDYKVIAILQKVITQQMQRDEFARNSRGFHYEYLISDLLDGTIIKGQQLDNRLAYIEFQFKDLIYITVADLAHSSDYINPTYIRNNLEGLLPGSHSLLYHGQIILLTTRQEAQAITKDEIHRFRIYCQKMMLFCGMSNVFHMLSELPDYYHQALRAVELGLTQTGIKPSLYIYEDYALKHLITQFRQFENAEIFCHSAIRKLVQYDHEKGTKLAKTLYYFLICERNSVTTASEMYIHRNTLRYRLKKINELIQLNLDDWKTREYLKTSLMILFD